MTIRAATNGRSRRVAVAGILHETNSFAPGRTELADFAGERVAGKEAFVSRYEGSKTSMGGVIDAAAELGLELVPALYLQATPSGMVTGEAAERMLEEVAASIPEEIDGLVLILHGAMVAEGIPDMEEALLARVRSKLGERLPIAVTLDLHANISQGMVALSDLIVGYDTYPHVDIYERAVEAVRLLDRLLAGTIRPVLAYAAPGMLVAPQSMLTESGPMKLLMDLAFEMETRPGILNVTVAGGFPYSDVPDAGVSFVVTADGDMELARACAEELSAYAWEHREDFRVPLETPEEAIQLALQHRSGPVILVEGSDNVGGGAPADATYMLARMTELPKRALAVICDPTAAKKAAEAGVGGDFHGEIGGKSDPTGWHGQPVHVAGKVRLLFDGRYRHIGAYMTGKLADMGLTAVIEAGRLTVVLTSERVPPWDPGHVRSVGLDPSQFDLILVKSALAWRTAFGDEAQLAIDVDTPGCCAANLTGFTYKQLQRPIYPLDAEADRRMNE
ncbi:microcystinase C [Paenibacillus sp. J31TS4]|uniref:M81 family metallopeptidase n=1 Tax=Paenibacillus sp. J31TS4 TaxID=2807195 RepID=UPI001B267836|nr:M81 family metallopeptidase [Paenibacillus sp. J31TS4]GIP37230.1 microcystinase C [Paenibacillus sp. J31TS4]